MQRLLADGGASYHLSDGNSKGRGSRYEQHQIQKLCRDSGEQAGCSLTQLRRCQAVVKPDE